MLSTFLFCFLSLLHTSPVCKAIEIVDQENEEADNNRKIREILKCREYPERNENDIVQRVRESEIGTSSEAQECRYKARRHRQRARQKIRRIKGLQDEIKREGDQARQQKGKHYLLCGKARHLYLRFVSFIWIF